MVATRVLWVVVAMSPSLMMDDLARPVVLFYAVVFAITVLLAVVRAEADRSKALHRHGYALVGSPPQVVSNLVWVEAGPRLANHRAATMAAAASLPLVGAGVVSVLDWSGRPDLPGMLWFLHLFLAAVAVAIMLCLRVGLGRAGRLTGATPAAPTHASAWSVLLAAVVATVGVTGARDLWPGAALGAEAGVVGLGLAVLAVEVCRQERRLGRPIGLWELWPSLGPRTSTARRELAWRSYVPPDPMLDVGSSERIRKG